MNTFIPFPHVTFWSRGSIFRLHSSQEGALLTSSDKSINRSVTSCRMRNRGGFRPPPLVPSDPTELRRAIELLGSRTQRKIMKKSTEEEIKSLVGALPESREAAQRWKVALQRGTNRRKEHLAQPNAFKNRKRLAELIRLPEDNETVNRCFILLGCLQRRYRLFQPLSPRVLDELTRKLGSAPNDEKDVHHYIKTLVFLQRERRSRELRPPQIPLDDLHELEFARMLLGTYAVKGSAGKQNRRLENVLGTLPRNKNIAASWKKVIEAAIRKKRRKERVARKREEIALKRLQRKLRRQQHELENTFALRHRSSPLLLNGREILRALPSAKNGMQEHNSQALKKDSPHHATLFVHIRDLLARIFGQGRR